MGFGLPWAHGFMPSAETVPGTDLRFDRTIEETDVGRLLQQFRGKPRIEALVAGLCAGRLGRLEIALWQCMVERRLDTAIGRQLDVLGRVLGVDRDGRNDTRYRRRLRAEILVLRSSGEPDRMIRIAVVFASTSDVELEEIFPASLRVILDAALDGFSSLELARLLHRAKPAGVGSSLEWGELGPSESFEFGSSDDPSEQDEDRGFSSTDASSLGGALRGVFLGTE